MELLRRLPEKIWTSAKTMAQRTMRIARRTGRGKNKSSESSKKKLIDKDPAEEGKPRWKRAWALFKDGDHRAEKGAATTSTEEEQRGTSTEQQREEETESEKAKKDKKEKRERKDKKDKGKKGKPSKKQKEAERFLDTLSAEEQAEYLHEIYESLAESHRINMPDLLDVFPGYERLELQALFLEIDEELKFDNDEEEEENVEEDWGDDWRWDEEPEEEDPKKEKKKATKKKKEDEAAESKGKKGGKEKAKKSSKVPEKKEKDRDKTKKNASKKEVEGSKKTKKSVKSPDKEQSLEELQQELEQLRAQVASAEGVKAQVRKSVGSSKEELPVSMGGTKEDLVLKVWIISCRDLEDADWGGKSDPFVVLEVLSPKGDSKFKAQTPVLEETLNPVWNSVFALECCFDDVLSFTVYDKDMIRSSLLGRFIMDHDWFYPFNFEGEVVLQDKDGLDLEHRSHMKVKIDIKKDRTQTDGQPAKGNAAANGENLANGRPVSLDLEDNAVAWEKAHHTVNMYQDDCDFVPSETGSSSLNTIVALAESGVKIPESALAKVLECISSGDRRFKISSLLICRALGTRMSPYTQILLEAFNDPDEGVRAQAVKVFGTWGEEAEDYVVDIAKLTEDRMHEVRHAALETLGELSQGNCLQALVAIGHSLSSEDVQYRLVTLKILATLGVKATPQAFHVSELVTKDPHPEVRVEGCRVLANLGLGTNTVQSSILALFTAEKDPNVIVREAAAEALNKLESEGRDLPMKRRRAKPKTQPTKESKKPVCGKCGFKFEDDHHAFCSKCGAKRQSLQAGSRIAVPERKGDRPSGTKDRERPPSRGQGGSSRVGRATERSRETSARRERPVSRR